MKKLEMIVENEFASVDYDAACSAVIVVWKRTCTSEAYRLVFTEILEKISEYRITTYISDIQRQGIIGLESRSWLQNEVLPKAYKGGLKKIATIAPNDVFSKFYIESVKNVATGNSYDLEFQYFDDLESAQRWAEKEKLAA